MTLTHQEIIDKNIEEKQENLKKINELKLISEEMKAETYSPTTKARINQVANQLMAAYRDYRGALIKTALKRELTAKIVIVCERTIAELEKKNERLEEENKKQKDKSLIADKRKIAEELANRVYKYKEEYIRGFSKVSEGIRDWDCLIDLIEDSYVLEENLIEYGIDLSIPPEEF